MQIAREIALFPQNKKGSRNIRWSSVATDVWKLSKIFAGFFRKLFNGTVRDWSPSLLRRTGQVKLEPRKDECGRFQWASRNQESGSRTRNDGCAKEAWDGTCCLSHRELRWRQPWWEVVKNRRVLWWLMWGGWGFLFNGILIAYTERLYRLNLSE